MQISSSSLPRQDADQDSPHLLPLKMRFLTHHKLCKLQPCIVHFTRCVCHVCGLDLKTIGATKLLRKRFIRGSKSPGLTGHLFLRRRRTVHQIVCGPKLFGLLSPPLPGNLTMEAFDAQQRRIDLKNTVRAHRRFPNLYRVPRRGESLRSEDPH